MTRSEAARIDVSALYGAHRLQLVRMAILLVDDLGSAEDVVQDAFAGRTATTTRSATRRRRWVTCVPPS
ncbi:MAG: hypothetical protein QOD31_1004 [Pseudonocardiales bacterium]|nr:hypothetical protein [Pseudonocardiales bacterium]